MLEGLAALSRYLENDGARAAADDAGAALRDAGIPEGVVPAQTLKTLGDCSADQLKAISDVGKSLEDEGMLVNVPGGYGRVFFFG